MRILPPEEFAIKVKDDLSEDDIPTAEIIHHGKATGQWISGAVLEAVLEADGRYVVFLTDDVPFEEMLKIQLLDEQFNELDSVTIGSMYATGTFSGLEVISDNKLAFKFNKNQPWRMTLLPQSQFSLPYFSTPKTVHRSFGFQRNFRIE